MDTQINQRLIKQLTGHAIHMRFIPGYHQLICYEFQTCNIDQYYKAYY